MFGDPTELNLRHLRAFEAIARLESFSRASEDVNLSQPALTQAVLKLEAQFEVKLFKRTSRGSFPTEHGKILQGRVMRLFAQLDAALHHTLVDGSQVSLQAMRQLAGRVTMTQVRALIAVDRKGSLAGAARAMGISAPALHRTTRDLESMGRRALFHRNLEGVRTTRTGSELARRFQLMLREIDYAVEELDMSKGKTRTRLKIGMLPFSRSTLLADAINTLSEEFPDTQVYLIEAVYDLLLGMLRDGRIDFLYGVLRRPKWASDIVERPLFYDPYAIVVRRGHPLTRCNHVGLSQLADYDWIVGGVGSIRRGAFEKMFQSLGYLPRASIEAISPKVVRALLSTSNRITLLTRLEIEFEQRMGALETVNYDPGIARNADGLVTRADWLPTPLQSRFIRLLHDPASAETSSNAQDEP